MMWRVEANPLCLELCQKVRLLAVGICAAIVPNSIGQSGNEPEGPLPFLPVIVDFLYR